MYPDPEVFELTSPTALKLEVYFPQPTSPRPKTLIRTSKTEIFLRIRIILSRIKTHVVFILNCIICHARFTVTRVMHCT
jgi:hypothetical protein